MSAHDPLRREFLVGAGLLVGAAACGAGQSSESIPARAPAPSTPPEALALLQAGNQRFVAGTTHHAHESAAWRKMLSADQHPFAILLCCSDSRVPPELVFDQGFGDLFVIRVAGNVIAEDVLGSISYGMRHLGAKLLVVMGHEGCGAVTAAVKELDGKGGENKYIEPLLRRIEPGLVGVSTGLGHDERVHAAVEANVRWSMQQVRAYPEARAAIAETAIDVVGAVYELETGVVRFLS